MRIIYKTCTSVKKAAFIISLLGGLILIFVSHKAFADIQTAYLFTLSNFKGAIPYNRVSISLDAQTNEIYVIDPREKDIGVFNDSGMEVYRFGDDGRIGTVFDLAVEKNGNLLILTRKGRKSVILRCNYRGEPLSELSIKNLPAGYPQFSPVRIVRWRNRLYLLDPISLRVMVCDINGLFKKDYDVAILAGIEEKKRFETGIVGFSVDRNGNMLFTIPVLFSAYRLSPDGTIKKFGRAGSAPGGFGIVSGIVSDGRDNYYLADQLKSVVIIFDRNFQYQKEFGFRGVQPDNLVGPRNLLLDNKNRLYVSQIRNRGVSVFKVSYR